MAVIGIIANPASGKDIRRLVAYGAVFNNLEKVNIVRRILLSLASIGIEKIVFMPDYYGIVPRAVEGISEQHRLQMEIVPVDICITGTQRDTLQASLAMAQLGVDCIVTLGGDGTNRIVAKGCGSIPIVPVSTGTNNVFSVMVEGTIAGLAAGVVAQGIVKGLPAVQPSKQFLVYKNDALVDSALVDVVVLNDEFIGSRAVWDVDRILQAFVTQGEPHNLGISSIAGNLQPVGARENSGLAVDFGPGGTWVRAPIAPGLIELVQVDAYRRIAVGESVPIRQTPCVIALDGEREIEVQEKDVVFVQLVFSGPQVVDIRAALHEAVGKGYSRVPKSEYK